MPATLVMTEPFAGLADSFATTLGMPGYHRVMLPHPVATRSLSELGELARAVAATVCHQLVMQPPRRGRDGSDAEREIEDVVIVGSGPAGYTAALYAARARRRPLVLEGLVWGGLLQDTTDVENYPGFAEGLMGPELMQRFRAQAEQFGSRLVSTEATRIEAGHGGAPHVVWAGATPHRARTVILAMGAEHRKLGVSGEVALAGRGVSYCATCDAPFFGGEHTIVVGGGDTAMEEAISLAKYAADVVVVHRRRELRASRIMIERAGALANVGFLAPYEVQKLVPGEDGALAAVRLRHGETGACEERSARGAFVAIGHEPRSALVRGVVELDADGYVVVHGRSTRTSVPGIFAAGDLVDRTYRQAVTAAGSGCQAALDAEHHLALAQAPARAPHASGMLSAP